MPQPIRFVLFDLDGTLIDSAPDICSALGQAHAELGLPVHDVVAVRKMIGEGQRILVERSVAQAGGAPALVDEVLPRFRRHYSEHLVEKTTLYPGVKQTLAALAPRLPLAVATNKPGDWARRIVKQLELEPYLRWVMGEDDVGARKPDPRLLLTLCERAGVTPDEALMVGDSAIDRAAARAANMRMALCTYGFTDAETLHDATTDRSASRPFIVDRFAELLPLFDG
jgi:phosphoglycolate phosphatase